MKTSADQTSLFATWWKSWPSHWRAHSMSFVRKMLFSSTDPKLWLIVQKFLEFHFLIIQSLSSALCWTEWPPTPWSFMLTSSQKNLEKAITTCKNTCPKWDRGQAGHKKLSVNHVLTKVEQYLRLWFSSQSSKLLFAEEAHVVWHEQRKAERRRTRNMDYRKITMQSKSGKTSYSRSILKRWTAIYKKNKFFLFMQEMITEFVKYAIHQKFFLSGGILIYGQIKVYFFI